MSDGAGELRAVANYIRGGQQRMLRAVSPVVTARAKDAQRRMRANLKGTSIKRLPRAVTYELLNPGRTGLSAEIGPDQSVSGLALGREFGSVHTGPRPFVFPVADEIEEPFGDDLERVVGDAWENLP